MKLTKEFVNSCRRINVLRDFLCQAIDQIDAMEEERRWRKCSEDKPPHDTWCIVYHEGEIDVDHYTDDCNTHDRFVMYGHYVTHWMPLPSAPKEGA